MPNLLGIISQIFARCSCRRSQKCRRRPKTVDKLKSAAYNENNKSSSIEFQIQIRQVSMGKIGETDGTEEEKGHNFF